MQTRTQEMTRHRDGQGRSTRALLWGIVVALLVSLSAVVPASADPAQPVLSNVGGIQPADAKVRLHGKAHPGELSTSYRFEYGPTAAYGRQTEWVPIAPGSEAVVVWRQIKGLEPETTYHFRLVAKNDLGQVQSVDHTVTTTASPAGCPNDAIRIAQGSTHLPDCRAYEKVSPGQKNHDDILATQEASLPAVVDGRIVFGSRAGLEGSESAPIVTYNDGRRSPAGWVASPISPPVDPWPSGFTILAGPAHSAYYTSADGSKTLMLSYNPHTPIVEDAENVKDVRNLYIRDNDTGEYTLVTSSVSPQPPNPLYWPRPVAFADDGSWVVFESILNLTADATGSTPKLYMWRDGQLGIVGVLPGQTTPATGGSVAATFNAATGASAGAATQNRMAVSSDAERVYFHNPYNSSTARLYLRRDGQETVWVSRSEATTPDPTPRRALLGATIGDGSMAAITTSERLLDADTNPSGTAAASSDVYLYADSPNPDADSNLTLISKDDDPSDGDAPGVVGVLGMGTSQEGGTYVYFAARSKLISGQPDLPAGASVGIYVWHDGTLRYIAPLLVNSVNSANWQGIWTSPTNPKAARVSPDGRYLVFRSSEPDLINGHPSLPAPDLGACLDTTGRVVAGGRLCYQQFHYDAEADGGAGRLACASCDPTDGYARGDVALGSPKEGLGTALGPNVTRALTDDGRLFFDTPTGLVAEDVNNTYDVYELRDGDVRLLSTGKGTVGARFAGASGSGDDVYFVTRDQLVGWDTDNVNDMYTAHVGGGFPEPPPQAPRCTGDECQGKPSGGAAGGRVGSDRLGAGDDVTGVRASFSLAGLSAGKRRALAAGRRVTLGVRVNRAGRVSVRLRARISGHQTVIARGTKTARRAGVARVALRLSPKARRVARAGGLRAVLVVRFTGAAGEQSRTVRLVAPDKRAQRAIVSVDAEPKGR